MTKSNLIARNLSVQPVYSEDNFPVGHCIQKIVKWKLREKSGFCDKCTLKKNFTAQKLRKWFNSRRKIDHSMVDLVLKALESTDAHIRDYWFLYSRCEILLAFCWYQYFDNLNFLSGFYLSKTRGRSAFFRENYNLNTLITYEMSWNSPSLSNQTFWKRWWPQVLF